jgi:hypothetical protein
VEEFEGFFCSFEVVEVDVLSDMGIWRGLGCCFATFGGF